MSPDPPTSLGTGTPRVSVIVPTFQRRDLVTRAVHLLAEQTMPAETFEIIVVVDGSTDGTAEHLRSMGAPPPVTVLEQLNLGKGAACNAGARGARGDLLLFLDDDLRADPRLIEEHLRAYDELGADAVMGLVDHDPASPVNVISEEVRRDFQKDVREWGSVFGFLPEEKALAGAQFSVRRSLYERVGGFDESFTRRGHFGHADNDLGIRLRAAGARIAFNGRAVAYQTFVRDFDGVLRQYEEYGYADVRLARKHGGPRGRQPWPLPPAGSRPRAIALTTLRHPAAARRLGDLIRPVVRIPYDRGATGRLTRRLTYALVFDHRYWLGVARAGGGHELGVDGPPIRLLTLAYHRLTPSPHPESDRHLTKPEVLIGQVHALLQEGWELVTPHEVAQFLSGRGGLPLRSLLVTFDDGYQDLATEGLAVMEQLGTTALAFVVTGALAGGLDGSASWPALDGRQLEALATTGRFEIGAHSRTHQDLTRVSDDRLASEVEGPVSDLERFGLPAPRFMAYPFGGHDPRVRAAAAGYLGAFTVDHGLAGPDTDCLCLPRISVGTGTTPDDLVRQVRALSRRAVRRRVSRAVRRLFPPVRPGADATPGGHRPTGGRVAPGSR